MDAKSDQRVLAHEIVWHAYANVAGEGPVGEDQLVEELVVEGFLALGNMCGIFDLIRDENLGEVATPKMAIILNTILEKIYQPPLALHRHTVLFRCRDSPLE